MCRDLHTLDTSRTRVVRVDLTDKWPRAKSPKAQQAKGAKRALNEVLADLL